MDKAGYVYMMANRKNGTIYTGVTSDLAKRVYEHREALVAGFTKRYGCKRLVWFEACPAARAADQGMEAGLEGEEDRGNEFGLD